MARKVTCPIEGCTATGCPEWVEQHAKLLHKRCPSRYCNWVGVGLGHHLGQVQRLGYGPTHRATPAGDELLELATTIADAGHPEWAERLRDLARRVR